MSAINPVCPTDAEQEKSDKNTRHEAWIHYMDLFGDSTIPDTRDQYGIQIDKGAEVLDCPKGSWVQAWVWLPQ
tara:strand:+ start:12 stop:230 length:219 start_codon:yes stop_codon:yes gene_type:complete